LHITCYECDTPPYPKNASCKLFSSKESPQVSDARNQTNGVKSTTAHKPANAVCQQSRHRLHWPETDTDFSWISSSVSSDGAAQAKQQKQLRLSRTCWPFVVATQTVALTTDSLARSRKPVCKGVSRQAVSFAARIVFVVCSSLLISSLKFVRLFS